MKTQMSMHLGFFMRENANLYYSGGPSVRPFLIYAKIESNACRGRRPRRPGKKYFQILYMDVGACIARPFKYFIISDNQWSPIHVYNIILRTFKF